MVSNVREVLRENIKALAQEIVLNWLWSKRCVSIRKSRRILVSGKLTRYIYIYTSLGERFEMVWCGNYDGDEDFADVKRSITGDCWLWSARFHFGRKRFTQITQSFIEFFSCDMFVAIRTAASQMWVDVQRKRLVPLGFHLSMYWLSCCSCCKQFHSISHSSTGVRRWCFREVWSGKAPRAVFSF